VGWGFGSRGFLGPVPVDETTPTWSGPCWATIATGTGVAGHGITGNNLTGHRLAEHPDFVTVATRAGVSTLLAVSGRTGDRAGRAGAGHAARSGCAPRPGRTRRYASCLRLP